MEAINIHLLPISKFHTSNHVSSETRIFISVHHAYMHTILINNVIKLQRVFQLDALCIHEIQFSNSRPFSGKDTLYEKNVRNIKY
jgi:hypothetical protein